MIYDMIWYDIWYDMIWYDMMWYDEPRENQRTLIDNFDTTRLYTVFACGRVSVSTVVQFRLVKSPSAKSANRY